MYDGPFFLGLGWVEGQFVDSCRNMKKTTIEALHQKNRPQDHRIEEQSADSSAGSGEEVGGDEGLRKDHKR